MKQAYYFEGVSFDKLGKNEQAIFSIEKALKFDANYADARNRMKKSYDNLKNVLLESKSKVEQITEFFMEHPNKMIDSITFVSPANMTKRSATLDYN